MTVPFQTTNKITFFLLFCSILTFITISFFLLHNEFKDTSIQKRYESGDSKHYLNGAKEIASGDFTFTYIKRYPHREILYPAVLSIPLKLFGNNLYALGSINILFFSLASLLIFYFCKKLRFGNIAALFAATVLLYNKFTFFIFTYQLLTEAMFIAIVICALALFLLSLNNPRTSHLLLLAACCGIAQDIRPNGCFIFGAFLFCLLPKQLFTRTKDAGREKQAATLRFVPLMTAVLVFLICSAPSWAPRVYYFGNPMYHGYLPNFLWSDTYAQAHDSDLVVTFADYLRNHSLGDLLPRMLYGMKKSFLAWPRDYIGNVVWLALVAGIACALLRRQKNLLLLAAVYGCIMTPIVWTVVSNPTPRIGFAFTLPFAAFFGAYALESFQVAFLRWSQQTPKALTIPLGRESVMPLYASPRDMRIRIVPATQGQCLTAFALPPYASQTRVQLSGCARQPNQRPQQSI